MVSSISALRQGAAVCRVNKGPSDGLQGHTALWSPKNSLRNSFNMLKFCAVRPAWWAVCLADWLCRPLSSCSSTPRVNVQADVIVSVALKDKGLTWSIWRQIISETQGDTWQRFNSLLLNQMTLPDSHCLASFLWLLWKKRKKNLLWW